MAKLILLRHGASAWNERNLFTGWVDIPLSSKGIEESFAAGKKISNIPIDVIFISALDRARATAMLVMSLHRSKKIPRILHTGEGKLEEWSQIHNRDAEENTIDVISAWQLNERMYGELQGMDKQKMREKFGEAQVHIWRRSYDVAPPGGESLKMTAERSIPYFNEMVVPYLKKGKNVFLCAHGNSLRSIVMVLDRLSETEVVQLEIPTGAPLLYHYEDGRWTKS